MPCPPAALVAALAVVDVGQIEGRILGGHGARAVPGRVAAGQPQDIRTMTRRPSSPASARQG